MWELEEVGQIRKYGQLQIKTRVLFLRNKNQIDNILFYNMPLIVNYKGESDNFQILVTNNFV